jgi:hypothetical protein
MAGERVSEAASGIVCVGGSHVVAVAAAARKLNVPVRVINLLRMPQMFIPGEPGWRVHRLLAREIGDGSAGVYSMLGGNEHTVLGLVRHPRPFDFVLPEDPQRALDPDAELLPYQAVRELLEQRTEPLFHKLSALARHCGPRLSHVESPPPATRWSVLAKPKAFRAALAQHGVAGGGLRYRLWRLYSSIVRSYCQRLGVPFIDAPAQTRTRSGFLLPQLVGDATHGNARYGRMVLERIGLKGA